MSKITTLCKSLESGNAFFGDKALTSACQENLGEFEKAVFNKAMQAAKKIKLFNYFEPSVKRKLEIKFEGNSIFVKKNRLVPGNHKVSKAVLIFNLPARISCPDSRLCRSTCYALKDKRYPAVTVERLVNFFLSLRRPTLLFSLIERQLQKTGKPYVRFHSSGDFYSKEYRDLWKGLVTRFPEKRFFGYTKSPFNFRDFPENFNLVESILPDGSSNYGSREYVIGKHREFGYPICPYGITKKEVQCGKDCKLCLQEKHVLFLQH